MILRALTPEKLAWQFIDKSRLPPQAPRPETSHEAAHWNADKHHLLSEPLLSQRVLQEKAHAEVLEQWCLRFQNQLFPRMFGSREPYV